jgi:hypothetical protein
MKVKLGTEPGNEIFKTITAATGLPEDLIRRELAKILANKGIAQDEVTMDDLRAALADYLREVILHAKDKFEDGVWIEEVIPPEELGQE